MRHIDLTSSAIKSAGFEDGTLEVRFNSGALHRYEHVDPAHFEGLVKADSPGAYFATHIRPTHTGTKVDEGGESGAAKWVR